jgi:Ca2+-binding RTX toxin-like protein
VRYDLFDHSDWLSHHYARARNGQLESSALVLDDGRVVIEYHDAMGYTALGSIRTTIDASGAPEVTAITYDDGTVRHIDWQSASAVSGIGTIAGTDADDAIRGSGQDDTLIGHAGADYMQGFGGNDTYYVDDAGDIVAEQVGSGTDSVNASVSFVLPAYVEGLYLTGDAWRGVGNDYNNFIFGNDSDNRLDGLRGHDTIEGRGGNDTLVGGTGNDRLIGGGGADVLYGNAGADEFVWYSIIETGVSSSQSDVIMDFTLWDWINLSAIDADETRGGDQAFEFIGRQHFDAPGQIRYLATGEEVRLLLNTDGDADFFEAIIRVAGTATPSADWFDL